MDEYGAAQSELIGKAVVLTDGKAGTVENVWLDELHGLRISIEGHDGKWPVSTMVACWGRKPATGFTSELDGDREPGKRRKNFWQSALFLTGA